MKKTILIILSLVLSLAIMLPGATAVMADSEENIEPAPTVKAALMIRAPSIAEVGQPVTITVFARYSHQPVAEAEVYALKTDKIAITADKMNYTTNTEDNIALLDEEGIFLGETNNEGNVTCKFADSNRYMLIAFKNGYVPGFSRITITLSATKGLYIKVPASAEVKNPVTMTVFERSSHEPVANAAVYARKIGNIDLPKPAVASIFSKIVGVAKPRTDNMTSTDTKILKAGPMKFQTVEIAYESQDIEEFQKNGIFLGYTNDQGELVYTFNETGHYVLAATKEEYAPGFARINITPADQKALGIKAPARAEVSQPVTIAVLERHPSQPVEKAEVYALRLADAISAVPQEKPTITTNKPETPVAVPEEKPTTLILTPAPTTSFRPEEKPSISIPTPEPATSATSKEKIITSTSKSEPIPPTATGGEPSTSITTTKPIPFPVAEVPLTADTVKEKGIFIGYTNEEGQVVHSFDNTGRYFMAAIKDGYAPGFARINIVLADQKDPDTKIPEKAQETTVP